MRQLFSYFDRQSITAPMHEYILDFRRYLESTGHKPTTVALYLAACRRFFSWTEQAGIYPNIALGVKTPKQEPGHKKDCFNAEQLHTILDSIDRTTPLGRRNFALIALMAVTGLRTIEVVRANIEDIRKVEDHTCLFVQGKGRTSKKEFVKVPPPVCTAIYDSLADRGLVKGTEPLFVSMSYRNIGKRLSARGISLIYKEIMQKAGFNSSRLTAHSFRHSAITLSMMAGIPLSEIRRLRAQVHHYNNGLRTQC